MRILLLILTLLFSSCYVYEGTYSSTYTTTHPDDEISYWRIHYVPTVSLYYHNHLPYWGYHSGYYYYYGYRHLYPWWYYYNFTPPYYYGVTTHVHCHLGNNGYVYRPRGNWRHNNKTILTYHHDKVHNTGIKVKNNSNRPIKWRNTKVNITPKTNTRVKTNTNYTRPNINIKSNTNKNRSNIRTNNRSNTKININKSNNRTKSNRSRPTNTKRPR